MLRRSVVHLRLSTVRGRLGDPVDTVAAPPAAPAAVELAAAAEPAEPGGSETVLQVRRGHLLRLCIKLIMCLLKLVAAAAAAATTKYSTVIRSY
jgi:hypothetical protein